MSVSLSFRRISPRIRSRCRVFSCVSGLGRRLLIANRGEICIRIARAAADLDIQTVGIYAEDDASCLHTRRVDECIALRGVGPRAYLDSEQIVRIARDTGCSAVHPGYGFLSESSEFAHLCHQSGIAFVGPTQSQLALFGDKSRARQLAVTCGVPVLPGTLADTDRQSRTECTTIDEAIEFVNSLPVHAKAVIKACSGGGGRGMRVVDDISNLPELYSQCRREAEASFGDSRLYMEMFLPHAKHIEVQIVGDGTDVFSLGDRECSLQRSYQKLIEVAPSPTLSNDPFLRQAITDAALKMARETSYQSLGTFEFLVDMESGEYYFIETNSRLQVEHTVTEMVSGVDVVQTQLRIAAGDKIRAFDFFTEEKQPSSNSIRSIGKSGYAIQSRINMERLSESGVFMPTDGIIQVFEPPFGQNIRVDTLAYSGYQTSSNYDSLLAKIIVYSRSNMFSECIHKMRRALAECRIEGIDTNLSFLIALLDREDVKRNSVHTRYVDDCLQQLYRSTIASKSAAGAKYFISPQFSLASSDSPDGCDVSSLSDNLIVISTPMQGRIVAKHRSESDFVNAGDEVAVIEAMKMEHVIVAPVSGVIRNFCVEVGIIVQANKVVCYIEPSDCSSEGTSNLGSDVNLDYVRMDLKELQHRVSLGGDSMRCDAVEKRHKMNHRTARENLSDLVDDDTFVEYGALAIAAQRRKRSFDDLIHNTPGDGMVCGIGSVNGAIYGEKYPTQCVVISYDYMVLAGTQGIRNHHKKDRMFDIARRLRLPVILLAEGGGGRPGDTDTHLLAGLDCMAFRLYAELSGVVPRVGIASGRCFAGNAALLGSSDVVIATADANIGMGGPAMIEGGGLGKFSPEEIGPVSVQVPNGVVDILVQNEAEAMDMAKKYLSYFQGPLSEWECCDQRNLRHIIPENRLRVYDTLNVISALADVNSVMVLRREFAPGMITALVRIEGRPMGLIANNPTHLSGAITSDGADKAARFMQLCDAFDLPILSLCDTPGIMVGPDAEKTALVRHAARIFVTAGSINVPVFTIVLRKAYGLGAQAMAGGSFKSTNFTISWPTGEFGGMGLEGAVTLGHRKELENINDPEERKSLFEKRVKQLYEVGKAVNYATAFEIDAVIDPAESRKWILTALKSAGKCSEREPRNRHMIDTW